MKLLEIDKVVQSHATAEEPAWVWMEEIPDGADPETWIDVKFFRRWGRGYERRWGGILKRIRMPRKRKRKKTKDLRGVNPDASSYWEELLRREGLQMAAGRNEKLSYVGASSHLETIDGVRQTDSGRVVPEGSRPE
jgi:hypothetical protein